MDTQEALELAQSILDDADDVPEEGEDFAASVAIKAEGIMGTIEKTARVTDGQASALRNMRSGLDKWLP